MKLDQLRQLLIIEQHKSITKAAKSMYIGQPALSNTLNSLEKELGVQIFARTPQGIEPTADGQIILQVAHKIVKNCDFLLDYHNHIDPQTMKGTIKVSLSPTYGYLYFDILTKYQSHFPNVDFHLTINTFEKMKQGFQNEEYHIALELSAIGLPEMIKEEKLLYKELKEHRIMLFAGPKSKFYDRNKVNAEELQNQQFIAFSPEYWTAKNIILQIQTPPIFMNDSACIRETIHKNNIIGTFPDTFDKIDTNHYEGRPRMIPLDTSPLLSCKGYLIYPGNRQLSLLERKTIHFLHTLMTELE